MATIQITVNNIPQNDRYLKYLKDSPQEIFLPGDSISGSCTITAQKSGKFKHKGITVRLIGRFISNDTIQSEFSVQEMKISQSASIDKTYKADFTFEKPRIQFPSFHGCKMALTYHVVVEVKQITIFPTLYQYYEIVFLQPIKRTQQVPPISINVSQPPLHFNITTSKGIYSTDEMISGEIAFSNAQQIGLQKVALYIILIEKMKEKKEIKTEETPILKYELIDGTPKPGSKIPFRIRLTPYCFWTFKNNQTSLLNVSFRIDVHAQRDGNNNCIAQHPIHIYQRELA
ncbi:hypothetical protein TRFO_17873 [Tritrichomonas foetus]|uniref:Arrestin-like N-terminal domain-containing protein n=1 Tax=Tritrichomonas foetus TaxID=1144522 RepID=A0A1J4KRE1_9EUKA|nr:hypothetical protein TRFO_17873 [Tritrichomonas foetus]|eukprot:OHT12380.1 hypothetical protein TRFO_17873 [Tritrichomonas foetus]